MADAAPKPKKLGRGLSSLLGAPVAIEPPGQELPRGIEAATPSQTPDAGRRVVQIPVELLDPSPFQPRQVFDEAGLLLLADSIKTSGIMQPLLIRRKSGGAQRYELIAGERRLRAAQIAGLTVVPCLFAEVSDQEAAEWSLMENLQREDLNPIDKAYAFKRLVTEFKLTQIQVAERLGVDRYSVAHHIRITEIEPEIQQMLREGKLHFAHARALLQAPSQHPTKDPNKSRLSLARRAVDEGWSVRKIDHFASAAAIDAAEVATEADVARSAADDSGLTGRARSLAREDLERQIGQALGTNVKITGGTGKNAKGKLVIEFYSLDQFEGLLRKMGVTVQL